MTYQRASEIPRKGRTEQELRIESLLRRVSVPALVDHVYCFACRSSFQNQMPDSYPSICRVCYTAYDEKGFYCLPDFILQNGERQGVLYVNGGVHEKEKQRKKDKYQVSELRSADIKVFVLNNSECDNMTNATLMAYLKTVWRAVADDGLYDALYRTEKEYPALR